MADPARAGVAYGGARGVKRAKFRQSDFAIHDRIVREILTEMCPRGWNIKNRVL